MLQLLKRCQENYILNPDLKMNKKRLQSLMCLDREICKAMFPEMVGRELLTYLFLGASTKGATGSNSFIFSGGGLAGDISFFD